MPRDGPEQPEVRSVSIGGGPSLAGQLYLSAPQVRVPSPALVALTPYGSQRLHATAAYFAVRGYAFLALDLQGRGDSAGEFDPATAGEDGARAVAWTSEQEWCNGRVGMWGGSY